MAGESDFALDMDAAQDLVSDTLIVAESGSDKTA